MRYLPLVPSDSDPAAWPGCSDFDLGWVGGCHPGWASRALRGAVVHAVHFPGAPWGEALVEDVSRVLAARLGADFLVLKVGRIEGRLETSRFFYTLQALLEATHSRGVKLALRPAAGTTKAVAALLKEMRGEAVGFCWDQEQAVDLEAISDRLFCAVGKPGVELGPLLHLGYRWSLALDVPDAPSFHAGKALLEAAFPPVLFPAELPKVAPDEGVTFGRGFGA
jgi:hypothetical protein